MHTEKDEDVDAADDTDCELAAVVGDAGNMAPDHGQKVVAGFGMLVRDPEALANTEPDELVEEVC